MELAYIGQAFHGWQSQTDKSGIQDHLESALRTVLRDSVRVTSASRTDSGVNAERQVCSFKSSEKIDENRVLKSLNSLLHQDISVIALRHMAIPFHPIRDSTGKVYRYMIWNGVATPPFIKPYVWRVPWLLDLSIMRHEMNSLVGTHDFTSMCATDSNAKTMVRKIFDVRIESRGPLIEIWIAGEGFLKQMVRNIVGTLVDISRGKISRSMLEILEDRTRTSGGVTAPGRGLFLVEVFYGNEIKIAEQRARARNGFCFSITTGDL